MPVNEDRARALEALREAEDGVRGAYVALEAARRKRGDCAEVAFPIGMRVKCRSGFYGAMYSMAGVVEKHYERGSVVSVRTDDGDILNLELTWIEEDTPDAS